MVQNLSGCELISKVINLIDAAVCSQTLFIKTNSKNEFLFS